VFPAPFYLTTRSPPRHFPLLWVWRAAPTQSLPFFFLSFFFSHSFRRSAQQFFWSFHFGKKWCLRVVPRGIPPSFVCVATQLLNTPPWRIGLGFFFVAAVVGLLFHTPFLFQGTPLRWDPQNSFSPDSKTLHLTVGEFPSFLMVRWNPPRTPFNLPQ